MTRILSLADRPDLRHEVERTHEQAWPRFILDGRTPDESWQLWDPLLERFPEFQLIMLDERDHILAAGHSVPLAWDGSLEDLPAGWSATMTAGVRGDPHGRRPNTLSALSMAVLPSARGRGIAPEMLMAMRSVARDRGFGSLIGPVRPSLKDRYPLTPIDRYVQWARPDGSPFDPWIRAHWRLGAVSIGVAQRSMIIVGTVSQWETWAGLSLPESGDYVIPGALVPVTIDREKDEGRYEEPNFWMKHPL